MKIRIADDFDPAGIAESGQCFRWSILSEDTCRVIYAGKCLYIVKSGEEEYDLDCTEEEFSLVWRPYFDLDENYRSIRGRIDPERDPFLYEACERKQGIRILRQDPWEALVSFIISQNRNIPAIKNSIELISRMAGERKLDNRGKEFYTFPAPKSIAALSERELTDCRLGYRTGYVKAAGELVAGGGLDFSALKEKDDDSALEELMSLYGVGRKVASCMLLFGLHHLNAFPVDVWIRRVINAEYPDGYPMEEYAPYNGVYQQYMFAYYRNDVKYKKE